MKTFKKIIGYLALILFAITVIYPLIHWFKNPELTEMQIFVEFIWWYIASVAFLLMNRLCFKK